ncbi:MAG: hypothetical protein AABX70_07380 [Nanoarchaeota archaeon]
MAYAKHSENEENASYAKHPPTPKKRRTIWEFLATYQAYHNFIEAKQGETPCMKERITRYPWTWGKLLNAKISSQN